MTKLADFSGVEADLLVSLPFKAGIFVSHAEDEEGEQDDEKEINALQHCIRIIANNPEGDAFVKEVAAETLKSKDQWEAWTEQSFRAPEEARKAATLLTARVPEATFKKYRSALMEIAGAVALAYGEFGMEEDEGFFTKIMDRLSRLSHDDKGHPMNTSPAEDSALSALAAAFKI